MKSNIVFSGPAHSGKSTLAGYILVHSESDDFLVRMDEKIKSELGDNYDDSRRFSYYVDTAKVEREKSPKAIGTSKYLHMRRIALEANCFNLKQNILEEEAEVLLIDSPGSNTKWKSRYQSNFMGDIAVIFFDLGDFKNLSYKLREGRNITKERRKLLWPIYLWKESKSLDNLIVVISKMDGNNYQHAEYHKKEFDRIAFASAVSIINWDSDFSNIPIVPISIDIKNRKDVNVYTRSIEMNWYKGNPLMLEMKKKVDQFISQCEEKDKENVYFFATIEKKLRIKETQEPAFRIKVINGQLCERDRVYLTQTCGRDFCEDKFGLGEVTIKSLKREDEKRVKEFVAGDIGGVTFSKIIINNKVVKAVDLKLSRVSYLVDKRMGIQTSNLLFFKSILKKDNFFDLQLHDKINILMFGKIVSTVLIAKYIEDKVCYFCVYAKRHPITLPILDNGTLPFPKYILEKENMSFMPVELYSLGNLGNRNEYVLFIRCLGDDVERDEIKKKINNCVFVENDCIENKEEADSRWKSKPSKITVFYIRVNIDNLELIVKSLKGFFFRKSVDYSIRVATVDDLKDLK